MKPLLAALIGSIVISATSWAQAPSSVEQEFMRLENEWSQAQVDRDAATLQRLFADEIVLIDAAGSSWNKADAIANLTASAWRQTGFKYEDLKVNLYGEIAVVTGRHTIQAVAAGRNLDGQFRFTDVFVKRNGRWQCVSSQLTPIGGN